MIDEQKQIPDLMTPNEVAKRLRRSISTLARDRQFNRGIPYVKYGHNVFYKKADVVAFLETNTMGRTKTVRAAS